MTSRDYLDLVHLDCYHGYRVIGNQSLSNVTGVCTANGNWSVEDMDCERESFFAIQSFCSIIIGLCRKCYNTRFQDDVSD